MFTARLFENICVNWPLRFGVPSVPRIIVSTAAIAVTTSPMSINSACWKPTSVSSRPPTKKPTPLSAFFEPVRIATHRNRASDAPSGTTSLTALLELIFVRSLAMPESAWAAITYGTTSHASGASASNEQRHVWIARPATSVVSGRTGRPGSRRPGS